MPDRFPFSRPSPPSPELRHRLAVALREVDLLRRLIRGRVRRPVHPSPATSPRAGGVRMSLDAAHRLLHYQSGRRPVDECLGLLSRSAAARYCSVGCSTWDRPCARTYAGCDPARRVRRLVAPRTASSGSTTGAQRAPSGNQSGGRSSDALRGAPSPAK